MEPLVDIVVLTWNRRDVTERFVESFFEHTKLPVRLIIIDNASTDGTGDYLRTLKSTDTCTIETVFNSENRGFVEGVNQGLTRTRAPYICLANNDLLFTPNWLDRLVAAFKDNPQFGLLNPNSNNLGTCPKGSETIESLAARLQDVRSEVIIEMPFCIGFCMMLRREVFEIVGGLSVEFKPMFFEDTDYSLKVRAAGYLIGMVESSYVWHSEHASFGKNRKMIETYFQKSKKIFHQKWGKTLRVAIDVDCYGGVVKEVLQSAIEIARAGNFVFLFNTQAPADKKALFFECSLREHAGVQIVNHSCTFIKLCKLITKKKKFDVIVSRSPLVKIAKVRGTIIEKKTCAQSIMRHK